MPLMLVLGPANSAKAGEVLGAYATAARRGALLIVPTALDAEHYSRELAEQGAVIGAVLTFRGLAREIARRTGYTRAQLSELQREHVVRRTVDGLQLTVLARSAAAPGFALAAGDLLAELQRALVTPQRFAQALRAWAAEDERRGPYADDLASIYRAYTRELERIGRDDTESHAWHALDALRAQPGRWGETAVFFYGFDDLPPLERDAIETLSRIAGAEVTVSLSYEAGRAALSARAEVVQELRAIADQVTELPALDEHYAADSRTALHHLERSLFEPEPEPIDPGDAVLLLEAGGERAEAELVAGQVSALVRDGTPPEEIVVVCRSLAHSAPVLEQVFARYGVPLASRRRIAFTHTPLGHAVRALARCALLDGGERAQDLLDYLRAPGLLERPELADGLEFDLRRDGAAAAADARERLGWELGEIDALRDADDPLAELARQARRLLTLPYRAQASVLSAAEELDARALGALLAAADELAQLGDRLDGEEAVALLDRLELRPPSRPQPGAVLLADPLAIRARRFRAVFVYGLSENEFPQLGAGEPFLSDERRRELATAAGLVLPAAENAIERERYLLYACVSRATERIAFSYRSSDEEGNLVLPSPFIADLAELFAADWFERRRRRLLADVVWPGGEAPTARERARAAAAGGPRLATDPAVRQLGEIALRHVRHSEVVSGGALEHFADCPIKWFVERELSPERFEPEPDALARGSFMHLVLEEVIGRLDGPVTAASLPDALRMLEDVLAEIPASVAPGRSDAVRSAALRAIEADLRRYLEHEAREGSRWQPDGLELRFGFEGEDGSLPAVNLGDRVRLRGVIDRVDVDVAAGGGSDDADGARRAIVRDYKSGSTRPAWAAARWEADRQLQVALYMLAVRELLGVQPVAGVYQPLGGGDLRPRGAFLEGLELGGRLVPNDARTQEELDTLLDSARERAVAIAAALRAGELEPCPSTCSRDGCMYPGICRSG